MADDVILARSSSPLRPSNDFQGSCPSRTMINMLLARRAPNLKRFELATSNKYLLGNSSMNKSRPLTKCKRRSSYDDKEIRHTSPHHVQSGLGWRGRELPADGVLVERKNP
jgi:hypothetical protein